jgi:hypothetical protein
MLSCLLEREKQSAERSGSPEGKALWQVGVAGVRQLSTCKEELPTQNHRLQQAVLTYLQ